MTERIFDDNPLLESICSDILSIVPTEHGFAVTLDRTVFFPRGGGQPCDGGTIDGIDVLDVFEENGEILHILAEKPQHLTNVPCKINISTRLEHMQQHTAQHVFSACAEALFNDRTIIARIESDSSHIELERPLTHRQLMSVAERVREIIAADLPITCRYYTPQEAKNMPVRGKITPHEQIRLVAIDGFDLNACGGTHCASTGAIKDICFTGEKLVRGVYRIYFCAGDRLSVQNNQKDLLILRLGALFGCENMLCTEDKINGLIARCEALNTQLDTANSQLMQMQFEQAVASARPVLNGNFIVRDFIGQDTKQVKAMCERLILDNVFIAAASRLDNYYNIIVMQSKGFSNIDIGQAVKAFLSTHGGKGGGSKISAQGMVEYSENVESDFRALCSQFYNELLH